MVENVSTAVGPVHSFGQLYCIELSSGFQGTPTCPVNNTRLTITWPVNNTRLTITAR